MKDRFCCSKALTISRQRSSQDSTRDFEIVGLPNPKLVIEMSSLVCLWLDPVAFNGDGETDASDRPFQFIDVSHVQSGCSPDRQQAALVCHVADQPLVARSPTAMFNAGQAELLPRSTTVAVFHSLPYAPRIDLTPLAK
jgi:hypothetical protein